LLHLAVGKRVDRLAGLLGAHLLVPLPRPVFCSTGWRSRSQVAVGTAGSGLWRPPRRPPGRQSHIRSCFTGY